MGMKVQSATNTKIQKNNHQKDILKKETLHFQIKTAHAARAAAGTGDWEGFGAAATGKCWNSLEFQVWR